MPELHAIINPAAGHGKAARRWPAIAQQLRQIGFVIHDHVTRHAQHAEEIASNLAAGGVEEILVVGGDGTLHEIVNGLLRNDVKPLARPVVSLMPLGTGRDFARSLGLHKVPQAVAALQSGHVRVLDVGVMRDLDGGEVRCFINMADAGLGAQVAERVNRSSKALGGFATYAIGALREIVRAQSWPARVLVDGRVVHDGPLLIALLANGRFYGGGMLPAPHASLDDRALDIVVVDAASRWNLAFNLLPRVYRGVHIGHRAVHSFRGSAVELQMQRPTLVSLDGELRRWRRLSAAIVPGAIRFRVSSPENAAN